MPTETEYTKTISTSFPNGLLNSTLLTNEIASSTISIALDRIDTAGDLCSIWFRDVLSETDQTTLNAVVSAHSGQKIATISTVKIEEESTPTGGNFSVMTIKVTAAAHSSISSVTSWPFPVSALSVVFIGDIDQINDSVDLAIGPDTVIGVITSNIVLPTSWVSQNYTVGQTVTYTHPVFGSRVYTCIVNTVNNEPPTKTSYWLHGFEINVNSTVIKHTMIGYYLSITNGVNLDKVDRVLNIRDNKIYVETAPATTYLASSPTYIRQTVYPIKNYLLGQPGSHSIGESKIGGSYMPKDTIVKVTYNNNSDSEKSIVGSIEYLY